MPTATITAKFVWPPKEGRKTGTIKTVDGAYYDVWPDKLASFKPNGIYEVEYSERESNGRTYRTITNFALKGEAMPQRGRGGGGGGNYRPTDPKDAERMFCCALVVAGIRSGTVQFDTGSLTTATNAARNAWAETFGADAPAAQEAQQAQKTHVDTAATLIAEIRRQDTVAALRHWGTSASVLVNALNDADRERVRDEYSGRLKALTQAENLAA